MPSSEDHVFEAKATSGPTTNVVSDTSSTQAGELYEIPELKARFSVLSTIGIQYSIIATPLAVGSYLTFILGVGGSPYFFYCYLVAMVGQLLLCASMAEIAAVFPHASGQVFWTAALSPVRWARPLSYWNGATTTLGWTFATAGTFVFTGQIFAATGAVAFSSYKIEYWHVWLICIGCGVVSIVLNIWLFPYYPYVTKFMVWFINAGTIYVLVALLARTHPKASVSTVFVDVINESGWSSNGVVFLLGFLPGVSAISCFDTAAHMAEELPHPERQVPQVMMGTAILSAFTGLPMIVVYLFCTPKPLNLLEPIGHQPVFQIFWDGFNSYALTIVACVIYAVVYLSSCPAVVTTLSRIVWSLSKHGAWPFTWIGHVEPARQIPVNSVIVSTVIPLLIALIGFGPSIVLNGIFGAATVCFLFSYGMPIWLLLARGREVLPEKRYFNLGKFGVVINVLAVCWQLVITVFLCFPITLPVTGSSMNYASVVAVTGLVCMGLNWALYSHKHYQTPKPLHVEKLHGVRDEPN